ncbi:Outer membrane porin protein 32 precursor [Variovorax sp. PBS-H4]|uniref:porin n=1 Tax=Variovorax sp. PBS-H4 TaxID=434008 RepID=UPI001315F0B2|nr:porin [Variovorax sp. PBS-H4]VTU22813.1 Outer membrane porin protein 32 precursor [Variovorax sp. PBS-H4]
MKKRRLTSLLVLGAAGAASAQSNVTLFGVVDASVSRYSTSSRDERSGVTYSPLGLPASFDPNFANQGHIRIGRTALASSGFNQSRLGFRGTEDLGGGLAASFWLEAPMSNDDGQTGLSTFSRRSTVSLSGPFGEVRLGRDYTPSLWNDTVFDPFGTSGVGTNLIFSASVAPNVIAGVPAASVGIPSVLNSNYVRASNSIGYFLPPDLGGFYGQVMYTFHEKSKYTPATLTPETPVNNARAGRYLGARFGYGKGPLDIALAHGDSIVGDNFYAGTTTHTRTSNVGASYDFGPLKLLGEFSRVRRYDNATLAPVLSAERSGFKGYLVGFTVPVGAGLVRASFAKVTYDTSVLRNLSEPEASQWAIGYVHHLSRRTALYATAARLRNKQGAALNVLGAPAPLRNPIMTPYSSTGYDFGIRHAF